jgi:hypothetical protein
MNVNWTLSAIVSAYATFIGICYMFGFWTVLHFNILEFATPIEIIKSAVYPLIPAAIGILFWALLDAYRTQPVPKVKDDTGKIERWILRFMNILLLVMIALNLYIYIIVPTYYLFISAPEERLHYALPLMSFLSTIYFLINPPFLKNHKEIVRNLVIIFLCALPTVSYMQGMNNITGILEGNTAYYFLKSSTPACEVKNNNKMIYVGSYGSAFFFVNSVDKDICIERRNGAILSYYRPPVVSKLDGVISRLRQRFFGAH